MEKTRNKTKVNPSLGGGEVDRGGTSLGFPLIAQKQ